MATLGFLGFGYLLEEGAGEGRAGVSGEGMEQGEESGGKGGVGGGSIGDGEKRREVLGRGMQYRGSWGDRKEEVGKGARTDLEVVQK